MGDVDMIVPKQITNENVEEVLEQVMITYGTDLSILAYSYVKDASTAKDIVQSVFIKCYKHLPKFRGEAALKTWIYRITINQCKDHLQSAYIRRLKFWEAGPVLEPHSECNTEEIVFRKNTNEQVKRIVFELPAKYREVVFLHYFQDFSVEDISAMLNIPANTVKTRLRRGRDKLKGAFEEEGIQ